MLVLLAVMLCVEALGTATFLVLYLTRSDWRSTAVGRHLLFYAVTLTALYAGTFVRVLWQVPLSLGLLVGLHCLFAAAVWQRVALVVREQRKPPDGP